MGHQPCGRCFGSRSPPGSRCFPPGRRRENILWSSHRGTIIADMSSRPARPLLENGLSPRQRRNPRSIHKRTAQLFLIMAAGAFRAGISGPALAGANDMVAEAKGPGAFAPPAVTPRGATTLVVGDCNTRRAMGSRFMVWLAQIGLHELRSAELHINVSLEHQRQRRDRRILRRLRRRHPRLHPHPLVRSRELYSLSRWWGDICNDDGRFCAARICQYGWLRAKACPGRVRRDGPAGSRLRLRAPASARHCRWRWLCAPDDPWPAPVEAIRPTWRGSSQFGPAPTVIGLT